MDSLEQQEVAARRRLDEALILAKAALGVLEGLQLTPLVYGLPGQITDLHEFDNNMEVMKKFSRAFELLLDAAGIMSLESFGDAPGKKDFTERGYRLQARFIPPSDGPGEVI